MGAGKDPQPTYRPESPYPPDLAKARVEGDVELGFNLDPTGTPAAIRVIRATPANTFDIAAMEAAPSLPDSGLPELGISDCRSRISDFDRERVGVRGCGLSLGRNP